MFCQKCGKNLADDAKFCDGCGATVEAAQPVQPAQPVQQVVQQPVQQVQYVQVVQAPAAPNPMVTNFVSAIKTFWKNPVATVGNAAKSTTHEWVLIAAIGIVVYALAAAVVGLEMLGQMIGSVAGAMGGMVGGMIGTIYPFFAIFGVGLLVAAVAFFGVSFGVWLLVSPIFKKQASFVQVMNMVAVASLPLVAIHVVNMLVGLVFSVATFVLFTAALMMSVILLYNGLQKFDKLDKSPFYGFAIVMAAVVLVTCLVGMLYVSAFTSGVMGSVGNAIGGLGNSLGGLGDLGDLF